MYTSRFLQQYEALKLTVTPNNGLWFRQRPLLIYLVSGETKWAPRSLYCQVIKQHNYSRPMYCRFLFSYFHCLFCLCKVREESKLVVSIMTYHAKMERKWISVIINLAHVLRSKIERLFISLMWISMLYYLFSYSMFIQRQT